MPSVQVPPLVQGLAGTSEAVNAIRACATVGARVGGTVIDVALACRAVKSSWTAANIAVDAVGAGSAVDARVWRTVVDVGLAGGAGEPNTTAASEAVDTIGTCAVVLTRGAEALVGVCLTVCPAVACNTSASVTPWTTRVAGATVQARIWGAVVERSRKGHVR